LRIPWKFFAKRGQAQGSPSTDRLALSNWNFVSFENTNEESIPDELVSKAVEHSAISVAQVKAIWVQESQEKDSGCYSLLVLDFTFS
jgi:hypothetical protein